jgi:aryl sulfotransferase
MSGSFVPIASYPKSGNTWMRIFFEKLQRGSDFSINDLDGNFHGILLRVLFDRLAPVNAADLLPREVEFFLPGVFRHLAAEIEGQEFVKVHETARLTELGEWLIPPECVQSAIYLARHPYDVAVSTAHHFNIGVDEAVAYMADERTKPYARTRLPEPLPQYFGSWSGNVESWLDDAPYRVTFARYEDLLADPVAHFQRLARAVGFNAETEAISKIVEASRFERLQQEEKELGFVERPKTSDVFFRAGRSMSWVGILDTALRERLCRDHGRVMERLGYMADGSTGNMVGAQSER